MAVITRGAWKLRYIDNRILPAGWYWVNAGDPPAYSPASAADIAQIEAAQSVQSPKFHAPTVERLEY